MEKQLLTNETDYIGWRNHVDTHGQSLEFKPESYPCVVCYQFVDDPNGKDKVYYEFTYLSDFLDHITEQINY